jgi:hypothetical protein
MITKFDTANVPAFVRVGNLTESPHPLGTTIGYWVQVGLEEIRIAAGDYIIQDDLGNLTGFIRQADYQADETLQQIIKERAALELMRKIWKTFKDAALTNAVKVSIANTVILTLILIQDAEIQLARVAANNTGTTTDFNASRKTTLLALIDEAIAKL